MAIFDRVKAAFSRKDSAVAPMISVRRVGQPIWSSRKYTSFAKEGYTENVIAYRCIRIVAEAVAALPILAYEGDEELTDHPLLEVLRRPNPWQSGQELMDALVSYYRLGGSGFLEAVSLDGDLRELYALRPDRMAVIPGRRGYPQGWKYSTGSGSATSHTYDMDLAPGEQLPIMHIKEFNPLDDWAGMSPMEAAAFAVDVHNAAGGYNKALLDNSATPSGALVFTGGEDSDGVLDDEQFKRLQKSLDERHTGTKNAGRPFLLEGGLDWKSMGLTPRDMEFIEGKREAAREIALSFGVPPMILGIPGDNTYSNYSEARLALYEDTVLPLADKIFGAITNWMQPSYEGVRIGYDVDKVEALSIKREAAWERVRSADFITTDEKREATGYGPYVPSGEPGGSILVGGAMTPLDDVTLQPGGPEPEE